MSFLDGFLTEQEFADRLKAKFGYGGVRMLRGWRQQRKGPPWVKRGKFILYPENQAGVWLRDGVQQSVRSRKRSVA